MSSKCSVKNNFKIFRQLVKIYYGAILSMYSNKSKKRKNSKLAKIGGVVKFILIYTIAIIYLGFILGLMNYGLYTVLESIGTTNILFAFNAIIISLFILFISIPSVLATYYSGKIEEQFLTMPIKAEIRLAAKITASYLLTFGISIVNFIILAVIFTIKAGMMPILFYLWSVIVGLLLPIPVVLICYVFAILLMRFTKVFKNKTVVTIVGAIFGIGFAIAFQFINIGSNNSSSGLYSLFMQHTETLIPKISKWYLPVNFSYSALSQPHSISGVFGILALIVIVFSALWILLKLMSKMFVSSLVGFDEKKVRRMKKTETSEFINEKMKKQNLMQTLFHREFFSMLREPVYLLNGPFVVIIMPLILFVSLWVQVKSGNLTPEVLSELAPYSWIAYAGLASLMGFIHNVSTTAISRDAKFITTIKSMPISIKQYVTAKFLHATFFSVVGIVLAAGIVKMVLPFTVLDFLKGTFVSISFCSLMNCIGLFIDTIHPSLKWDNPTAAIKRNMNPLFEMLLGMAITAIFIILIIVFKFSIKSAILIFAGIALFLFIILYYFYLKFAEYKFRKLEL